jgi:hypothetical protein
MTGCHRGGARWTGFDRGGGLAVMGRPKLYGNDGRTFARTLC